MINHGKWVRYEPTTTEPTAPLNAIYWHRESDGADWYQWSRNRWNIQHGVDKTNVTKIVAIDRQIICTHTDATALLLPTAFEIYECEPDETVPELGSLISSDNQIESLN